MDIITIPKKLINNDDLVIIPRKEYEQFLHLKKVFNKSKEEDDEDTNLAIRVYKEEKRKGKLKLIKSLAELR